MDFDVDSLGCRSVPLTFGYQPIQHTEAICRQLGSTPPYCLGRALI
jgi:hypothetical protein